MPKTKTPTLNGLSGSFTLNTRTREELHIPPAILTSNFSNWKSVSSIVDTYFDVVNVPYSSGSRFYQDVIEVLSTIKEMTPTERTHYPLKKYAAKVYTYLRDRYNKEELITLYQRRYLSSQVQVTRQNAIQQGNITGNILAEYGALNLAEDIQSSSSTSEITDDHPSIHHRRESSIFEDNNNVEAKDSITIVKGNVIFKLQTPSKNVSSPNKPALQRDDVEQLNEVVDLCVDLDSKKKCSSELLELSNLLTINRKKHESLKQSNLFSYTVNLLNIVNCHEFDDISSQMMPTDGINIMMANFFRKIISEFALNTTRPAPYTKDDERTIYSEVFVPMFKYFSLFTQKLVFSWSEKAMPHTSSIWIIDSDYKKSGVNLKLLDGIGALVGEDVSWLLIESSGYFKDQNYLHCIEDCIKNVKNGTDSLKYIMSKYKESSIETFKKLKVFSVQIIQMKMTLICYQFSSNEKWKAYECCSADVPLTWSKRKYLIDVLEMFSFLYYQILEQETVYDEISNEALGIKNIDGKIKVASLFE